MALPPRDALVLCGFVRGTAHENWIDEVGMYNVRADGRRGALSADSSELRGEWLLLYGARVPLSLRERTGGWFVQTRADLLDLGYPQPRGAAYLCCPVSERLQPPAWLVQLDIGALGPRALGIGHPFAVSWAHLIEAGGSSAT
jgi:hypothetical protein